jgi:hypothetical protein
MDVTSLCTNIPHSDGIEACGKIWESRSVKVPPIDCLVIEELQHVDEGGNPQILRFFQRMTVSRDNWSTWVIGFVDFRKKI